MESKASIIDYWKYKPKNSSHSFEKFKLGSAYHQKYHQFKDIKAAQQLVGVIRATWKSQSNYGNQQIISGFIFGTGFMVTDNILMTCAHNIYSKSKKCFANEIQFIPGIQNGRPQHTKIRLATLSSKNPRNFATLYSRDFVNQSNSELEPCLQEICLIILDPIIGQNKYNMPDKYLSIGSLEKSEDQIKLKMIGYPSDKFRSEKKFQNAWVERVTMNGFLHSIGSFQIGSNSNFSTKQIQGNQDLKRSKIDQIINYTMKTTIGCSGSPILAISKDKQLCIVGIHTHRGREDDFNSGVYFGTHMIQLIKQLQNKLHLYFKQKLPATKIQNISYMCQQSVPSKYREPSSGNQQLIGLRLKQHQNKVQEQSVSPQDSQHSSDSKLSYQQLIGQDNPKSQQQESEQSQKESQESSCMDEAYIQDFLKFLSIKKVSSQSKYESYEYSFPSLKKSLDFFNNNLFYATYPILLSNPHLPDTGKQQFKNTNNKKRHRSRFASSAQPRFYLLSK